MLVYNLKLIFVSGILFAATIAAAAHDYDDAPRSKNSAEYTRKSGDMYIWWGGRRYRSLSNRRGSLGARSFRGRGLHGGK